MNEPEVFNPEKNPKLNLNKSERLRRRKNFLPTAIVTVFLWGIWSVIFLFVPPETFLMPVGFLTVSFLALLFTASLIFAHTRRGLLASGAIVLFMVLRYYGMGNYLNAALLAGIVLCVEFYFSKLK